MRRVLLAAVMLLVIGCVVWRGSFAEFGLRVRAARAVRGRDSAAGAGLRLDSGSLPVGIAALLLPPVSPGTLLIAAGDGESDAARYARGVADVLRGKPTVAVETFNAIPAVRRDGATWTNLAVAEAQIADGGEDRTQFLAALTDLDHADTAAAAHDREVLLRWIGIDPVRDHDAEWKRAVAGPVTDDDLARLTNRYPGQARTYAESVYLCDWADALLSGHNDEARLHRLRVIAQALRARGEGLLSDVVAVIDDAKRAGDLLRVRKTAEALVAYRAARNVTERHEPAGAADAMAAVQGEFLAVGSPMADVAACYVAINDIDANRRDEARAMFGRLIEIERASPSPHPALLAFAIYHRGMLESGDGNWSAALKDGVEASDIFRRLGEERFVGTSEGLVTAQYEFLGQPERAWRHAVAGMRASFASGDFARGEVILAAVTRAELRRHHWDTARALLRAERPLAARVADAAQTSDFLIRDATAASHSGDEGAVDALLTAARRRAMSGGDRSIRAKLLADVDAAEGSLSSEPARATALLTSAIAFQRRSGRAILLPSLYLARGRALRAVRRVADARRDFDNGIAALEKQRSEISNDELRPGLFDDARELFDEAVRLAIERRAPEEAFALVERGRGRAMREQLASGAAMPSMPAIARALGPEDLILEYAALQDRLVIFAVDRDLATCTVVGVGKEAIRRDAVTLASASQRLRPPWETIEPAAERLYVSHIAPVRERLRGKQNLIVVADPAMQPFAFAALKDDTTKRFVVEDFTVTRAPSAAVHTLLAASHTVPDRSPRSVAVFADPLPPAPPFEDFEPLPMSESEGRVIARRYATAEVAVREEATASRFVASAPAAEVVHFGGHAVSPPTALSRSMLLFAADAGRPATLSVADISRLRFPRTRVVVLAACSTLQGHASGVEGVPSLARAFLVAGVPSVIGTLADIDDFEAGTLVIALHDQLSRGVPPGQALRQAQLAALRGDDEALRHPGYWSAFELIGSPR